jgi:hypothetical protein
VAEKISTLLTYVIAGLDPAIQGKRRQKIGKAWMPGSSPGMTGKGAPPD